MTEVICQMFDNLTACYISVFFRVYFLLFLLFVCLRVFFYLIGE